MRNYRFAISFNLLLLLVFCLFILFYEGVSKKQVQEDTDNHAKVVAHSVWTLFTPMIDQYLSMASQTHDYQQMVIFSQVNQNLYSQQRQLAGFEATLADLKLIRVDIFNAPIEYHGQEIGKLQVRAFNKNCYLYAYLLIILLLVSLLSWFVALLVQERKTLKTRVTQKTAELANNNQQLQNEIIERKKQEKALRESEQTFLALFDHSFQFIALLDLQCRVQKINKTALNFRNLQESDVLGQVFWDTPWWQHSEKLVQQLQIAFAEARQGVVSRFEVHSTEVREIYLDITMKPVFDENQKVIHIIAEARDITDVRRAESELQQAQKMESVGTLAGGIAHDFNNILAGILGTLNLLKLKRDKGKKLSEELIFKHLDTVTNTALRAKGIVSQLLTLSRKYDLQFTPLNLKDTLEHVCNICRSSFDKSITIHTEIPQKVPVNADANSLEQVFLNLCINAAHAMTIMRPGQDAWGGTLSILLDQQTLTRQNNRPAGMYWQISISDTGVGMDAKTQEQIFTPFFTTKEKDSGSGLGLSMVYSIIKQHHGFIEVESMPGNGSRFNLYLPVCTEEQCNMVSESELTLEQGEGKILVIDDEELVRNSAVEILCECGYQVFSAEDGRLGVELYQQQNDIDVVLLDLVMPVMSGKETFSKLKELNPNLRVLLSSGFRHDTRVDEILAAGANGFIQKPYSLYSLSQAIKQTLSD